VDKKKPSLGRDVFDGPGDRTRSEAVKKILQNRVQKAPASAKEVEVKVSLTPSNIRHLETLLRELERAGKGQFTRDELIRVAITLLSVSDF
jgi:hypothetical protein